MKFFDHVRLICQKKLSVSVLLLLVTLIPLGCAPSASNNPVTKQPITATNPTPTRIVALTPITADIIHRMAPDRLVGISGSSLLDGNPVLKVIPRVSEGRTQPNLEKIVVLKPDLVIGAAGFHDRALDKLKSMGIATITTKIDSWRSLEDITRNLATTIQADPKPVLQNWEQCSPSQPSVSDTSTLVLVSRQPLLAPNKTSWAGDLLTRFGAVNVAAQLQGQNPTQGYVTLSPEKVLQANPNIMILVNVEGAKTEEFKSAPFWQDLRAVQTNRVYILDYYGFVNPGSIEAISQACQQLKQIYRTK
jgi:iron complex transport system substrate-binding protein